VSHQSAERH